MTASLPSLSPRGLAPLLIIPDPRKRSSPFWPRRLVSSTLSGSVGLSPCWSLHPVCGGRECRSLRRARRPACSTRREVAALVGRVAARQRRHLGRLCLRRGCHRRVPGTGEQITVSNTGDAPSWRAFDRPNSGPSSGKPSSKPSYRGRRTYGRILPRQSRSASRGGAHGTGCRSEGA